MNEFLPLPVRRGLYLVALAAAVAAPIVAVEHPDYAAAIVTGSGLLTAAALGTALANPTARQKGAHVANDHTTPPTLNL